MAARRRRIFPETAVQIALVDWVKYQHPRIKGAIIKIDNEGKRTVQGHVLARRCGLRKGASDLFIAYPSQKYHGLFIEVKPQKYKVTASNKEHHDYQMQFIDEMNSYGYYAEMCIGYEHGVKILEGYFNEGRLI